MIGQLADGEGAGVAGGAVGVGVPAVASGVEGVGPAADAIAVDTAGDGAIEAGRAEAPVGGWETLAGATVDAGLETGVDGAAEEQDATRTATRPIARSRDTPVLQVTHQSWDLRLPLRKACCAGATQRPVRAGDGVCQPE